MKKLHKNWCCQINCFGQHLFILFDYGNFDNFQKFIYLEHISILKHNENIHGGSQYINEAPHNFSLKNWKVYLGCKNRIFIEPTLNSRIHFLFGNIWNSRIG